MWYNVLLIRGFNSYSTLKYYFLMGGNTEFKNRVIYTHKTRQKIKGKMFGTLLGQFCVLVAPLNIFVLLNIFPIRGVIITNIKDFSLTFN